MAFGVRLDGGQGGRLVGDQSATEFKRLRLSFDPSRYKRVRLERISCQLSHVRLACTSSTVASLGMLMVFEMAPADERLGGRHHADVALGTQRYRLPVLAAGLLAQSNTG